MKLSDDISHEMNPASIPNIITSHSPISLHPAVIQPGSDISIPIIFSAPEEIGLIALLGLVIFGSAEDENDVAVVKLSHVFEVLASLFASVRSAKTETANYLVALEVSCLCVCAMRAK